MLSMLQRIAYLPFSMDLKEVLRDLYLAICRGCDGTAPDTQTPDARLCLAYVADVGLPGAALTAVVSTITDFGPDYVLDAGDNNYLDGDPAAWAGFLPWINTQRYLRVRGNHTLDTPAGIAADAAAFPYLFTDSNPWWRRVLGNGLVEVFGIETGKKTNGTFIPGDLQVAGGAQYVWLEAALNSSTARHKIVMLHHPPVSTGNDPSHDVTPEMDWVVLAKADAVLCGHVHMAEWLVWMGTPLINLSGSVQTSGTSLVRPYPVAAGAWPVFVNDIDPLIGRLRVTADDVVVEVVHAVTGAVESSRSIYDKTPRATRMADWIFPRDEDVNTADPYTDYKLGTVASGMRVHSVLLAVGTAGSGGGSKTVEFFYNGTPITTQVPLTNARVSGTSLLGRWIPAGASIVARVRGWQPYIGTAAKGLYYEILGDSMH